MTETSQANTAIEIKHITMLSIHFIHFYGRTIIARRMHLDKSYV
ncbi:hypothetical protein GCM10023116_21350 [Kistimonas scapharcae]|uniref:Uncharacterized protein n=1 Tax=Kistimonas scapharcae TaxID=1036133 RepID=A0ABP8V1H2_9GAMM